ncbi:MAG TPA: PPC domain-containing protein, partial [Pyrinomonadaceae bacterium]|nr:PPC domain-containing protein [Pyrinomonadaceae bacterium]
MLRLRYQVLALTISLFLISSVAAQQNEGDMKLSANEIHVEFAPAATAATLMPFHVEVNGRDDDAFDVFVSNPDAVISLILANGTEINSTNAASFGYAWEAMAADSEAVTNGLFISSFSRYGNHTLIGLPTTATAGIYQIKINTTGVTTATFVNATYISASPIRVGLLSDNASYTPGQSVVLSAFVFNGTTPITNATVEAFVMDKDHPEATPVQVTFTDSGSNDSETGDGIYTGVYTASTQGKFIASLQASGNSPAGFPYVRMTSTEFRVLPPLATFTSFSDTGVDDNGNSLFDRIVVTANLQVQQAGDFRLALTLAASNGQVAQASSAAQLATGAQQMSVSFTATQIAELGVNGPYTIKNATLYYTTDPEEPIAAVAEDAGQTSAYALTSLEREVVKFTGNNSVTGIDTNSNGKFDVLRIQVELNILAAATYNWSGTLKDSAGRDIQVIDGATSMSAGNNTLTFDFDGIKIAQHGVDGPYSLSSVLVFNDQLAVHEPELLKTQAFAVSAFECSDAPAATVQSATLTPTSLIGGNATTLHVTLAQAAGTCGAKVTINSSNPSVIAAAIPDTVIVPAGQTVADFTVITAGVSSATTVDLTATSGVSSQTATLTITPSSLSNLSLSFTTVPAGNATAGKVQLDGAAPLGDTTVSISSSNSNVATVPATAVIPAGQRSVEFTVNTNSSFQGSTSVNITATLGAVTKVASLGVYSETYTSGSITPGGPPVTVTATDPGQNFLLTFDGTAGQRVSLKMTDVNFGNDSCCGAHVAIKKPDGSYLVNNVFFGTSGGFVDATSLPVAGTYTIVVDPYGPYTGHATLTLYDVPADFTTTITPGGAPVTATTTVPGQNAQLTFAGTAGQRVSLKVSSVSMAGGSGYVEVGIKNPDGSVLTTINYITASGAFIDVQTLASTGTYTVFVNPGDSNTGSVTLTLYNVPADVTGNMTIGTPFTETTTVPGQNALLSFSGTAGQRVTINIGGVNITGGSGYVDVAFRKPDGTTLASANYVTSGGAFINTQTLPVTGVYTILVNPQDMNTGSVTLTVNDVSADVLGSIVVGGNAVTVTTTSAGQNALVSFDGNAGQRVSLKISGVSLTGGNGYVDVSIKKPDGTVLASSNYTTSSGGFIDVSTLPVTGTYTILVDPQESNVGSVTLTLYEVPPDTTGSITPGGAAVTVTTTTPGQNATLTFNGTAGQRVALVLTNSTYSGCLAVNDAIKKPDGTNLVSAYLCSASGYLDTVVLPVSGTYTILIDPVGTNVGSQTLTLIDVPADVVTTITPGGAPVTVATTSIGQTAFATFSGTANQRVSLKVSDATITGGYYNYMTVSILKPDGSSLTSNTLSSPGGFIDVQTLPVTGTYSVLIDPWDTSTASVTLTLYDVPADNSVSITPGGGSVTLTNTVAGQNAQATFTATANQRVSLNLNSVMLTGGYQNWVTITIKAPDGSTLTSNTYSSGSTAYIDTLVLAAGTYTILINPWDTATGSVTITLNDVPADATGTLTVGGSSLTLTTTVPGQNAMPIFSGTSGQQVSVGFTNNTMGTVTVTLLKPDGTSLTSITSSATSFGLPTQTLPATGTYSIKIDPSGPSVGSITVAVSEVVTGGTLQADYQFQ